MAIMPISLEHIHEVATLHCQIMPGLLSILGTKVTRAVYDGYAKSDAVVGFVYLEDDHVAGFVIGSATPRRLRRDALSRNGWRIALHVGASVTLHPRRIGALIDGLRGPTGSSIDDDDSELTYIGVSPRTRRGRVGTQLVDAFNDAMRKAGVDAYQLSVDGANESAVGFYRARGFRQIGEYLQFGALNIRYELVLDASPSPRVH